MNAPNALPIDERIDQCARAADFMEANPGCTLRELDKAADLGSASKVISEMRIKHGYKILAKRDLIRTRDRTRSRRVNRYWLIARPTKSQQELFPSE